MFETSRCWLDSMTIAQVCLRLATIKHVLSHDTLLKEHADVHQSCCLRIQCHFCTISLRHFREFGNTAAPALVIKKLLLFTRALSSSTLISPLGIFFNERLHWQFCAWVPSKAVYCNFGNSMHVFKSGNLIGGEGFDAAHQKKKKI